MLAPLPSLAADKADLQRIYDHIHKTFNTSSSLKMRIKDLKPSPIKGMLSGRIEFDDGNRKQVQPIHVTKDGRYYILSDSFALGASGFPGLRAPVKKQGQPHPPPMLLSQDAQYVLFGQAMDASIDPEKDAMSKIGLRNVLATGPTDAPVVVVEYSDLQCPACKKAQAVIDGGLMSAYEGKVRWVFKHYPLRDMHPWAYDAAIALACAGSIKPQSYRGIMNAFFREQKDITTKNIRQKSLEFANKAGINDAPFRTCFDRKESQELVDADIREAESLGIKSTPTIYINGRQARDLRPREFQRLIDEMLKKK